MFRFTMTCLCVLTLAACETVEGVGQDVENAGEVIQDEANK
ncbi:entericidin A/B family lipoprotein [Falsihalocynthiibacter arcticus]|nr:entericidin A/B family lipoprotein [Falsihalocynthiibacter arcticus]